MITYLLTYLPVHTSDLRNICT